MAEDFPPLKNDLILRVARGEYTGHPFSSFFPFLFSILRRQDNKQVLTASTGETVERPPIWVMRQGEAQLIVS
jgi:hypothetical protein